LLALAKAVFLQTTSNQAKAQLTQSEEATKQLQSRINGLENNNKDLRSQLDQKTNEAKEMQRKLKSAPVILIKDSDTDSKGRSLRFETGKANLPEGLKLFIENDLVTKLEKAAKEYPEYQFIDVIGHTDGQETIAQGNPSNLDTNLEGVATNKDSNINTLQPGSNTDLGLIRALAVVKKLQEIQVKNDGLKGLKFRAYSAGQLLLSSGEYAPSDRTSNPARRRIEIRFSPTPKQVP